MPSKINYLLQYLDTKKHILSHFFLNKTIFDHVTFTNRGTNANFFLDVIL